MILFYEHEHRNTRKDGWNAVVQKEDEPEGRLVSETPYWKRSFYDGSQLDEVGIQRDNLSSMKIGPGCTVHIYEHQDFEGKDRLYPSSSGAVSTIEKINQHDGVLEHIDSMEVTCDARIACQNPALIGNTNGGGDLKRCVTHCTYDSTDPQLNCTDGKEKSENCGKCQNQIQKYCSQNLQKEDCRKFCSNPYNKCDETKIVNYCNTYRTDSYCKCLLKTPGDASDTSTSAADKSLEKALAEHAGNNSACWNVKGPNACRKGTTPMPGQLQRPSWWQGGFASQCPSFCQAVVDFRDNDIAMSDSASINLLTEMNCGNTMTSGGGNSGGNSGGSNSGGNTGSGSSSSNSDSEDDELIFGFFERKLLGEDFFPEFDNMYLASMGSCFLCVAMMVLAVFFLRK